MGEIKSPNRARTIKKIAKGMMLRDPKYRKLLETNQSKQKSGSEEGLKTFDLLEGSILPPNQEIPDVASYLNNTKSIDTSYLAQMKVQTRECFIKDVLENKLMIEDLNDCFNEVLPLAFLSL